MAYTVRLAKGTEKFSTDKNETILEAALRNSILLPYGCRNGVCGSCKGKIINGEIEYREKSLPGITGQESKSGYALFCQAMARSDLIIEARQVATLNDIPVRKLPCRVVKIEKLNHDVLRLFLKLPAAERLQFVAGQYIDILMQDGKRRSFSLANAPHDDEFLELHVRYYNGGTFSEFAFKSIQENTLLRIEGPMGMFYLRENSTRPIIMIAGGTGFAPAKSIIEHSMQLERTLPVYLYWGARSRKDLYLHQLAEYWANQHDWFQYIPVLSEPGKEDQWHGYTGLVHEQVLHDFNDLSRFNVYASGPPPMVDMIQKTFISRGLQPENLFSDSFEFSST